MSKSDLKITRIEESPFSYDDIVVLLHESFEERLNQGLHFTCSYMTVGQFKERTNNSIVLVAWNQVCDGASGTVTLSLRKDKKGVIYGYHENLAINPVAKGQGVASLLQKACIEIIKDNGGEYEMSDTATKAVSSVQWHLKNGFKKIALRSFSSTNYYSVVFRKQIAHSFFWNSCLVMSLRFFISSLIIRIIYKEDGRLTVLGRITERIRK